jgi:hypothetical protein
LTYIGANLTIDQRPITVTADARSKTYGDAEPSLTYQVTSGWLVSGDRFSGSLTRVAGENVGSYAIQQGTLALSTNYALSYIGENLTIDPRPITITADVKTKLFGNPDPGLTYQITRGSLRSGDEFSGALTRDAGDGVGSYAIRQGTLSAGSNYSITYVGANLTIAAWSLKGFYQPVDMNGVLNTVKAGSTVPLKFEIFTGPTELTSTSQVTSLTHKEVSCTTLSSAADDIETIATGGTSLRYDATAGQFVYNWQTPKKAGACYIVTMTTQDGSRLAANFKLK